MLKRLEQLRQKLIGTQLLAHEKERIETAVKNLNSAGYDKWGLDPETLKTAAAATKWLYTDYFRTLTVGIEKVPEGRVLLIANHGGQLPIDGLMIELAMLLEANPPRVARGMVERWAPSVPFVSTLFQRAGQMVGDHRNCRDLLENEECVLAFPEGAAGSGKTLRDRYKLQKFGTGFMRLALETNAPIVPIAVIGSEETYPSLMNLKPLAALLKAPYFPVTPFFPLLGPLGAIPLPCRITLRFGEPMRFTGDADAPEADVERMVDEVRLKLEDELQAGLKARGENIFGGAGA